MTKAIYAGTFDPITLGHLDVIQRSSLLVDMLVVAVAANEDKAPLFDIETRVRMIECDITTLDCTNIIVRSFGNLLVDFAKEVGATFIVRGLRTGTDFEYENQIAAVNRRMCPDIDTILIFASTGNSFVASSIVKNIACHGGDVSPFVSDAVAKELTARLQPHSTLQQKKAIPGTQPGF